MQDPLLQIQDFLKERDVEFKVDNSLSELSFVKIGGICPLTVFPKSEDEFVQIILTARNYNLKFKVLGRMSNVLPDDFGCSYLIIKTDGINKVFSKGDIVCSECGRTLPSLASYLCDLGFSGFEELSGIPASVGGAVYMNAGAYGKEISDLIQYADVLDAERGEILRLYKDELNFSYRHSVFKERELYVISCGFVFEKDKKEEILKRTFLYAKMRRESQPISFPSLGSVFKKQNGVSAAYLIDKCGLKGARVGGAYVSQKHAGFIINDGGATSSDYKALIEYVKRKIYEKYGVRLEEEIEYLEF